MSLFALATYGSLVTFGVLRTFFFRTLASSWSKVNTYSISKLDYPHRAMFKLGGKNLFVLCLLVKNLSAVYSADRCDF